ncbi:MAG: GDSL-type esterase/lipase family protein [Candidatus Omnitrophica bacterium]|nr:GDSL-type esterase/lipase family protein [Candidatus Omnitrophota bacterium]
MKLQKILLIIFGIILSLVILEACLRLTAWMAEGHLSKEVFDNGGKLRILCAGDSYTYGLGVERQEAYPPQLEVLLKRKLGDERVEVINCGRPGMNTPMLANRFVKILDDYQPDIVLIMVGANDEWNFGEFFFAPETICDKIHSLICSLRISRMFKILTTAFKEPQDMNYLTVQVDKEKSSIEKNKGLKNIYYYQAIMLPVKKEALYAAINAVFEKDKHAVVEECPRSGIKDPNPTLGINAKERRLDKMHRIASERLRQMCSLAQERKIKIFLLSYPLVVYESVKGMSKKGVPFIDFKTSFTSVITPFNLIDYFLPDGHCTGKGYKIIADKVAEVLVEEMQRKKGAGSN